MSIVLARVDDRVIHGQITTRWMAAKPTDGILVISDTIANDAIRCKVLKAAAGTHKLGIYTIEQGVSALAKANESSKRFYIISDAINNFAEITKLGGNYGTVLNIGNLNTTRLGTKNVDRTFMLNDTDAAALDHLQAANIALQFQPLPDDIIRTWKDLKHRYETL